MKINMLVFIVTTILFSCCQKENNPDYFTFEYSFDKNSEGWIGDFADYPDEVDVDSFYEFEFKYTTLPSPLDTKKGALKQSGNNHSDDLFMFIKKKIVDLPPNHLFAVTIEADIATNAPDDSFGVGGSPGESVFIKAGASTNEPLKLLDTSDNYFRMNIDKGNQATEGKDMKIIGNFANGTEKEEYALKKLRMSSPVTAKSSEKGEIWIIVGTDSGFEATTTIYYSKIVVKLR